MEKPMKIEYIKISQINPFKDNPRKNDAAAVRLVDSIREYGFRVPIILDKDNNIIAGHTRYKAAKFLNMEELPCIKAENLTPEQVKAFRIADNKYGELAEWDLDLLESSLSELKDLGFNLELTRFNQMELDSLLSNSVKYEDFSFEDEAAEGLGAVEEESESLVGCNPTSRVIIVYQDDNQLQFLQEYLGVGGDKKKIIYKVEELTPFENWKSSHGAQLYE